MHTKNFALTLAIPGGQEMANIIDLLDENIISQDSLMSLAAGIYTLEIFFL